VEFLPESGGEVRMQGGDKLPAGFHGFRWQVKSAALEVYVRPPKGKDRTEPETRSESEEDRKSETPGRVKGLLPLRGLPSLSFS